VRPLYEPGDVFDHAEEGKFQLDELLADGPLGQTFLATSQPDGRRLTLKLISPSLLRGGQTARFRAESRTLSAISHPSVQRLVAAGDDDAIGLYWRAFDYIDGQPLSKAMGEPDPDHVRALIQPLAEALQCIHQAGILHRDISPENILLRSGDIRQPVLIDFGLSGLLDLFEQRVTIIRFAGRLDYAAPEALGLFEHKIGPWTDIYGLGLVAYELATGRRAFAAETLADMILEHQRPLDFSDLPTDLVRILSRMLDPDPDNRFLSAGELLNALQADAGQTERTPTPPNLGAGAAVASKPPSTKKRRTTIAELPKPTTTLTVAQIGIDRLDGAGSRVQTVYVKYPPHYAIYRTTEGVRVQCADDPKTAEAQRVKLAALAPVRGRIAGLLHAWRSAGHDVDGSDVSRSKPSRRQRTNLATVYRYDLRVADALLIALQAAAADAAPLLEAVRADIEALKAGQERVRAASVASAIVLALWVAAGLTIAQLLSLGADAAAPGIDLVLTAGSGAAGALISLLMRPMRGDHGADELSNQTGEFGLRIAYGVICALLLRTMLRSGIVTIGIGDLILGGSKQHQSLWQEAAIIGFLAGFSERLMPRLILRAPAETGLLSASTTSAALEDMRQLVSTSVRDTLSGAELTRFDGYVSGTVKQDSGTPGRASVELHFSNAPRESAARLLIADGVDAPNAEFVVEAEPEGSPSHLVIRSMTVPTQFDFVSQPIPLNIPAETDRLWIQIFQRSRLIQTFAIALRPDAPPRTRGQL
jgi:hypothetical protein